MGSRRKSDAEGRGVPPPGTPPRSRGGAPEELERTRLVRLFDRVPAFIAVVRGPDLEVELANPRFRAFTGGRELIGRPLEEALPELVGQGHLHRLREVYRTGRPFSVEGARIEVNPEDGPPGAIFVSYVCEPLREDDGTISGVFVHGVDVTALVRARKRAEAAVRSRDEMLAFVSHDLRQPIGLLGTVIHALMELDLPEPERRSMLERALRASEQADRLIDDLMDMARSDLDRLELRRSVVSLPALVEAALDALAVEADRKDVALESRVSGEPPAVEADADRIQRVLANLLGNAVRHTPEGGTVTVEVRHEGDAVACSVADTGPGVPEEVGDRIFERYWRGDDAGGAGIGLGLSIARDIVEAHGGWIGLEDASDGGSVFTFRLPLEAEASDADPGGQRASGRSQTDPSGRNPGPGSRRHFSPDPRPSHDRVS